MGFHAIDQSPAPGSFVDYLARADQLAAVLAYKTHACDVLARVQPLPGCAVLDVGCGRGRDLAALAERVGSNGRVVGVDPSHAMRSEARRVAPTASVVAGSAEVLPFAAATFDVVRLDRVLIHVDDPAAAVREARRVLRSGGLLMLLDGSMANTHLPDPGCPTSRAVVESLCRMQRHPDMGRRLIRLCEEAGLEVVAAEPFDLRFAALTDAEHFLHLTDAASLAVSEGRCRFIDALTWRLDLERRTDVHVVVPGTGVLARKP